MKTKTIVFTKPFTAELLEKEVGAAEGKNVKVKMEYTVVSGGTERSCITAMHNTSQQFPMSLGYCGVGYVTEIGEQVEKITVGDRVLVYHGIHTEYNVVPESDVTKVEQDDLDSLDAAYANDVDSGAIANVPKPNF